MSDSDLDLDRYETIFVIHSINPWRVETIKYDRSKGKQAMTGNNSLILNQATMQTAIQEYLEKRWAVTAPETCPKVTKVEATQQGGTIECFKVTTTAGDPRVNGEESFEEVAQRIVETA